MDEEEKEAKKVMESPDTQAFLDQTKKAEAKLRDNLRETCQELFGKHLQDVIKTTVSKLSKQLITEPYAELGKSCIQASNLQESVHHKQLLKFAE